VEAGSRIRRRRRVGGWLGFGLSAAVIVAVVWPGSRPLQKPGPMNVGHETLECGSCHRPAPGTTRQQLQANTRTFLGLRASYVDFGMRAVENADCRSCHDRPDDRHPVYRFLEPRFAEARAAIEPQACTSCHGEHTGRRATVEPTACRHCHADMDLQRDPISTPHAELARTGAWDTCLGCHDFHGNHAISVPTALSDAASPAAIERYLAGGESPYVGEIRHPARADNGTAQEDPTW
jgi:hypothetical protein